MKMKKILSKISAILLLMGVLAPSLTLAVVSCPAHRTQDACSADYNCLWDATRGVCMNAPTDVMGVLTKIGNWLFAILLVVAVIYIILAAFDFVTAGGDPEKVKTARNNVLYAMIGIAVAFLAKGLVVLVRMIVGS